jgi:hypothetical protein
MKRLRSRCTYVCVQSLRTTAAYSVALPRDTYTPIYLHLEPFFVLSSSVVPSKAGVPAVAAPTSALLTLRNLHDEGMRSWAASPPEICGGCACPGCLGRWERWAW